MSGTSKTLNFLSDDFILSFADSTIKMPIQSYNEQQREAAKKQIVIQQPFSTTFKVDGMEKDGDDACEIDSEDNEEVLDENSEDQFNIRLKGNHEESVRSSRTATFKSIRGTITNNVAGSSLQNNKLLK